MATFTEDEIKDIVVDPSDEIQFDDYGMEEAKASVMILAPTFLQRVKAFFGYTEDDGESWVDLYALIDTQERMVYCIRCVFVDNINHKEDELEVQITNLPEMKKLFKQLDIDDQMPKGPKIVSMLQKDCSSAGRVVIP